MLSCHLCLRINPSLFQPAGGSTEPPGYTHLLEEGGELLRHGALSRLVAQSDLLDGVLQELGHLQFDSQLRFQPLLLETKARHGLSDQLSSYWLQKTFCIPFKCCG